MCKYCEFYDEMGDIKYPQSIICEDITNFNEYHQKIEADFFDIEITKASDVTFNAEITIIEDELALMLTFDGLSEDTSFYKNVKINYCPFCGEKINHK